MVLFGTKAIKGTDEDIFESIQENASYTEKYLLAWVVISYNQSTGISIWKKVELFP